jgi:hypothetical protein
MQQSKHASTTTIQTGNGFKKCATPAGINYYLFDHVVNFETESRSCICCGEKLKRGDRALGIIVNCPQTVTYRLPGNFFIHVECSGALGKKVQGINKGALGKLVDELVKEYQIMLVVVEQFGKRWKFSLGR